MQWNLKTTDSTPHEDNLCGTKEDVMQDLMNFHQKNEWPDNWILEPVLLLDWVTSKWNVCDFEPIPDTIDAIEEIENRLTEIHGEKITLTSFTCRSGLLNYADQDGEICLTEIY